MFYNRTDFVNKQWVQIVVSGDFKVSDMYTLDILNKVSPYLTSTLALSISRVRDIYHGYFLVLCVLHYGSLDFVLRPIVSNSLQSIVECIKKNS